MRPSHSDARVPTLTMYGPLLQFVRHCVKYAAETRAIAAPFVEPFIRLTRTAREPQPRLLSSSFPHTPHAPSPRLRAPALPLYTPRSAPRLGAVISLYPIATDKWEDGVRLLLLPVWLKL